MRPMLVRTWRALPGTRFHCTCFLIQLPGECEEHRMKKADIIFTPSSTFRMWQPFQEWHSNIFHGFINSMYLFIHQPYDLAVSPGHGGGRYEKFRFRRSWFGGFLCIQRCFLHTLLNHRRCVALIASEFLDMALCGHFCFHCIKRKLCYLLSPLHKNVILHSPTLQGTTQRQWSSKTNTVFFRPKAPDYTRNLCRTSSFC